MLALYIIFGIIIFILFLLCLPVTIKINNFDQNGSYVRYLFLKIKINNPNKEKTVKKAKKKTNKDNNKLAKNKNNLSVKKIFKKFTLKEFINLLKQTIKSIIPPIKFILKHIKIYNLDLYLGICGEDTFDAAKKTGLASSFSYPVFYFICKNIKSLKAYNIKIEPLFLKEENQINLNSKIKFLPAFIVFPSLKILIKLLKFKIKLTTAK